MLEPKDEIRQKLDIADVLGEYLQLKPAGSGSFKAPCPFHAEKTPSFHISRERQIWHCFGCDKGGDIFAFVMEMEGMSFPEALRHLGRRAGVEVPEFKPQPKQVTDARDSLLAIHEIAQKFYAKILRDHPEGKPAREYLEKRGIAPDLAEKFGLGYVPDRWDALTRFLSSRGFTNQQIIDAGFGLRKKSGEGLLDRFRHRLMIPLSDPVGSVVGFTARTIGLGQTVTPEAPKYMNSPESPIYRKGEVLYGLHLAKTGIRTAKCVIIVEGNLDVVSSHKAGVENIVASSGTALTEAQLRTLSRYTKQLVFALDEDAAGFAAARRAFEIARTKFPDLDVRCLIIPKDAGKDPDEVVQKDPSAWQRIAGSSKEIIEFMFDRELKLYESKAGSAGIEERRALVNDLLAEVARIPRAVDRHLYILRLSDATHVDVEVLEREVAKLQTGAQPAAKVAQTTVAPAPRKQNKADRNAEFIIGLMLAEDSVAPEIIERVPASALPEEPWRRLYKIATELYSAGQIEGATNQSLYSRLRSDCSSRDAFDDIRVIDATLIRLEEQVRGWSPDVVRAELDRHIAFFEDAIGDARRRSLESAIREAELSQSTDTLNALLKEYAQLLRALGE